MKLTVGRFPFALAALCAFVVAPASEALRADDGGGTAEGIASSLQPALAQNLGGALAWFWNASSAFGIPTTFLLRDVPERAVAVGDFNDDGNLDLALSKAGSDAVWIVPGDGTGGFLAPTRLASGAGQRIVAIGDFNQDGIEDQAVAERFSPGASLLLGDGAGRFRAVTDGTQSATVLVADFDSNGAADLAVVDGEFSQVSILIGDGQGGLSSETRIPVGSAPTSVAIGDFNGDEIADLAVANSRSDTVSILIGDGSGGFGWATDFPAGGGPTSVAIGDFNQDERADLALSRSDSVAILLGDGQGNFGAPAQYAAEAGDRSGSSQSSGVVPGYVGFPVVSLTLSPATIAGGSGGSATGTVTIGGQAPAGGQVINLTSSNTDLAASTPSLVIPQGATSATFTVGTNALYRRYSALAFSATITATNPGDTSSRSATLNVTAQARPGGFPSDSSQRSGRMCGGAFPATQGDRGILFDCTLAPNFGTSGTCTFRQECTLGCQTVLAQSFTNFRDVCATTPPFPVTLTPRSVVGGGAITGTVNFATASQPVPLDAEAFAISNNAVAVVSPSGFFPVPTGATSVGFGVSTTQVTSPAFAAIGVNALSPQSVGEGSIFEAQRLGLAWLAVVPAPGAPPALPTLAILTLNPTSVVGGNPSQGTVTLSGPAPEGGAAVVVASHNTSIASVPTIVTVPAGATNATFTVTTFAVTSSTGALISARFNGVYRESVLTVTPPPPAGPVIAGLSFNPDPVVGGNTSIGTVTLSTAAPAGGTTVSLVSEAAAGPHVVSVPPSVTVSAGATSATFVATTTTVSQGAASNVRATLGSSTWSTLLDVVPLFANMTLNPTTVVGGNPSTGTVTLNGPAPSGGALVTLTSNNTSVASVPASVTVPGSATSANFTVTTFAVPAAASPIITASHGGVSFQRQVTVNPDPTAPPTLASLSLSPTSVVGGSGTSQGTVTLTAAAPSGGATVSLSDNSAAAAVPASVVVPQGSTSANFTVTTTSVMSSTSVTITAMFAAVSRTATLTVTPAAAGPLPAPTLVSPANDARFLPGQAITFDWSDVTGAASYTLQIDDTETFGLPLTLSQTVTASQFATSTLPTQRMWWRVRANDSAGTPGAWSAVRRVEVKN